MGGMFKHLLWVAPSTLAVLAVAFYLSQMHETKIDAEVSKFDTTFAMSMNHFAKSPAEKQYYEKQVVTSQRQYSSAQADLTQRKQKVNQVGSDLDNALK